MDERFSDIEKGARRTFLLMVIVVLALMMGLSYLIERGPSDLDACMQSCAAHGLRGQLIHRFTAEQTAGMHSKGPTECQCRQ
jgi:hypothetical protein